MFVAFCTLQAICIICVWAALVSRWIHYHNMPEISSYPLVDFAMKTEQATSPVQSTLSSSDLHVVKSRSLHPLVDSKAVRKLLKDQRTILVRPTSSEPAVSNGMTEAPTEGPQI